jgi:hypothetical protein
MRTIDGKIRVSIGSPAGVTSGDAAPRAAGRGWTNPTATTSRPNNTPRIPAEKKRRGEGIMGTTKGFRD